jgi:hypothetical protein
MCKNTGYLVTFSNSSDIALFDKRLSFRREKKGNKVTAVLHTYFILFVMTTWQSLLTSQDGSAWLDGSRFDWLSDSSSLHQSDLERNQFASIKTQQEVRKEK